MPITAAACHWAGGGGYGLAVKLDGPSEGREFVCVRVEGQLGDAQWSMALAGSFMADGLGREERCLMYLPLRR